MHDAAVRGGRVLLPDGNVEALEIAVEGGRIAAVASQVGPAEREIDAAGALVLPGLVDDHVHYREPGPSEKEDFLSGTLASAHGGATTVAEIQNNAPLLTRRELVEAKLERVRRKARVHVVLYGSATPEALGGIAEMADLVVGFKVFLAPSHGDPAAACAQELRALFEEIARSGRAAVVHAEDKEIVERGLARYGALGARGWSRARSARAEIAACERAIELSERTGCRVHLFHLSAAGSVDVVEEGKERGLPVTAATCPHYLLFTDRDVERLGGLLKCNPSIKGEADRRRLREGLASGAIDVLETDHAPHTPMEKRLPFAENPSGISSADVFLPAAWRLVVEGVLSPSLLVERASRRPAELLGLSGKGRIAPGADADLVLLDEDAAWTPAEDDFRSRATLSPYVGMELPARVRTTVVGGRAVDLRGGRGR